MVAPLASDDRRLRRLLDDLRYNEAVQAYNTSRRQFPSNATASVFRFKEYPLFQAPPEATQVPKVQFNR